jgi:hypothetical protein
VSIWKPCVIEEKLKSRKAEKQRDALSKIVYEPPVQLPEEHDRILEKLLTLYGELFRHDGYGTLRVEMRFLKKGQKEILLICGKEYRFVVNAPGNGQR